MLSFEELSDEAQTDVRYMVEFCINQGYCMGMDEGLKEDGSALPFRKELEEFSGV